MSSTPDRPGTSTSGTEADPSAQPLASTLKPSWVFAIALGSAVGWGAFILPVDWLGAGGTAGALIGFAIGAVLIGIIGVSYGMVIRVLPVTGGELAYVLAEFGRRHAFVVGWFLALAYACIVALNATAVSLAARMLFPGIMERWHLYTVAGWDIYLPSVIVACTAIVLTGIVNSLGTALSGRFQFVACVILLAAVAIVLGASLVHVVQNGFAIAPAFPREVSPLSAIAVMVAFAPWAFVGFGNVPQAAGEFDFSPKKALRLILAAIATSAAVYMAMVLASSIAVAEAGSAVDGSVWATADAIAAILGPVGRILMVIAVLMGVVTGLNGFTVSASRVLMTMSRAQMLPPAFGRVSARRGTPIVAIAFVTALCLVAPFFGRSALTWIVDMTSVGVTIAYGYTCLAAVKLTHPSRAGESDVFGRRRPLFRAIAMLGAVIAAGFLALLFVPGSPGQLSTPPLIALAVWVVLGAIFLALRHRRLMAVPEEELEGVVLDAQT